MCSCILVFWLVLLVLFVLVSGLVGVDVVVENLWIGCVVDFYELILEYQLDIYWNMDKVYLIWVIYKGIKVCLLLVGVVIVLCYWIGGEEYGVDDFMWCNCVGGVLVFKDGKVVLECYGLGNDECMCWILFLVVKLIFLILVGVVVQQGLLVFDQFVDKYLLSLVGFVYQGVMVEQVLQMSFGVCWNEIYCDLKFDCRQMFDVQFVECFGGILWLLVSLLWQYLVGIYFIYSIGELYLQSELLYVVICILVSDYLFEWIWVWMGMESDGFW